MAVAAAVLLGNFAAFAPGASAAPASATAGGGGTATAPAAPRVPQLAPAFEGFFDGVAATSASNAWAVGDYSSGTLTSHPLIAHWDGKTWKRVPAPAPGSGAVLFAVAAKSPSLAFAVGWTAPLFQVDSTIILKWNGHVWRDVTKPSLNGLVFGVGFSSAKSAWAVGSNASLGYNPNGWTLIEHWNGSAWG
jgi:hypothetical protein